MTLWRSSLSSAVASASLSRAVISSSWRLLSCALFPLQREGVDWFSGGFSLSARCFSQAAMRSATFCLSSFMDRLASASRSFTAISSSCRVATLLLGVTSRCLLFSSSSSWMRCRRPLVVSWPSASRSLTATSSSCSDLSRSSVWLSSDGGCVCAWCSSVMCRRAFSSSCCTLSSCCRSAASSRLMT
uniref:Uncharacterized protein n=1 Tax=Ixodes ricinus TaxID=34613 RepID=A0A6B0UZY5_IXORI